MLQMVGGSFTGLTVSEKLLVAVCPSAAVTLMVMVAVPFWFVAGVMTTVRLDPLPLKAMFSLGTSAGLEELHVRTRFVASVWASLTVNATPARGLSSSVVW